MIRPKIIVSGDVAKARGFEAMAIDQLAILKRQRELGLRDERRIVKPYDGVVITCHSDDYSDYIEVFVQSDSGGRQEIDVIQYEETSCVCLPNFSLGVIVDATPHEPIRSEYGSDANYHEALIAWEEAFPEMIKKQRFTYGVNVCTGSSFTYISNVPANGWASYFIGQRVLVTVGYFENEKNCDRKCLMEEPALPYYEISPIHLLDGMPLWTKEIFEQTRITNYVN